MNQLILENLNDLYNTRDGNIKNTYNIFLPNSQNQIQVPHQSCWRLTGVSP